MINSSVIVFFDLVVLVQCALAAREPPVVTLVNQGPVVGTYRTMSRWQRIVAYLGIPYAHPPTGYRRFLPPEYAAPPAWEGVRNATEAAPYCPQLLPKEDEQEEVMPVPRHDKLFMKLLDRQVESPSPRNYSEDCLYLNVFVPEGPAGGAEGAEGARYATLVWFHGGGWVRGGPDDVNPFQLVFKQKVIFVSVAYRLGILGFFSTLDMEANGNFGLMDQTAALAWLQNNIALFGGDKDNVCVMGQGSGAVSVGLHLASEWSDGLFHKAIAMSGNVLAPDSVKSPKKEFASIDKVASYFGCFRTPTYALLMCLRALEEDILISVGNPIAEWKPIVDVGFSNLTRPFISAFPKTMFANKLFKKVPLLTGYTDMEDALLLSKDDVEDSGISQTEFDTMRDEVVLTDIVLTEGNGNCSHNQHIIFDAVKFYYNLVPMNVNETSLRKQFLDFYTDKNYGSTTYALAKYMSPDVDVFCYRFDLKPVSDLVNEGIPPWINVAHNFDLVFVFGIPYMALPEDISKWDRADKSVSDIIMKMWANFAAQGNPKRADVYIDWDSFKADNPGFLIIDRSFSMSEPNNLNYKAFEFWNEFYPRVVSVGTECCNATDDDSGAGVAGTRAPLALALLYSVFRCSLI